METPLDDKLAKAVLRLARVHDRRGEEIAAALNRIADHMKYLGTGIAPDEGAEAEQDPSARPKD